MLEVFLPVSSNIAKHVAQALQALVAAKSPAILLLAFESLPHILLNVTSVDCVVHWGWPADRQDCEFSRRGSCAIWLNTFVTRCQTNHSLAATHSILPTSPLWRPPETNQGRSAIQLWSDHVSRSRH
jgi:hypothetical protein